MTHTIERPLKLGELLAETVRIYGERVWAAFGLGAVVAGASVLGRLHPAVSILAFLIAFTGCYAAAARLVSGDRFNEAWAQVGLRLPVLLVLTFVVSLPIALALNYLILLVFVALWLGLTGFSIPVTMLEGAPGAEGWAGRLGFAINRSLALARAEYLHAVGVAAALLLIYLLLGNVLAAALVGFAESGRLAASVLIQLVLAPLFFLGLAVLYFEQKARLHARPTAKG